MSLGCLWRELGKIRSKLVRQEFITNKQVKFDENRPKQHLLGDHFILRRIQNIILHVNEKQARL